MARKRASMREGPLAELFRRTEAAQRAQEGAPDELPFEEEQTAERQPADDARQRMAKKRGAGERPMTLTGDTVGEKPQAELILAVDRAMDRLATFNVRLSRIVECRVFAGMTDDETARALDTPLRTVQREWSRARAWLRTELEGPTSPDEPAVP